MKNMNFLRDDDLTGELFNQLRDFIYSKTGILFNENKAYLLKNRLKWRLEACGCNSYKEYLNFLKYDFKGKQELPHLYDSVTTNETSFFRDMLQINAFYNDVLPLVMKENEQSGRKEIKFWSAASSTGEEAYTAAMQMVHKGLLGKGWKINVVGTDISSQVIDNARKGVYGKNAMRNTPREYILKYFNNSGDVYEIKPEIKRLVRFTCANLFDSADMRKMRNFDIVFCRNVLIYFDLNSKKEVVSNLYDSLRPGGSLFIGYSESLHNISRSFKLKHYNRALVYQKEA